MVMAMSMPSEELQLLIAGYVLGDLSPEEAATFEQALAQDPTIAAEVSQFQQALEAAYAPPELAPPPDLRSRLLTNAPATISPALLPTAQPVSIQPTRRFSLRTLLEVAAAAAIALLGINNYRLAQDLQISRQETQQYAALTLQLQATQANNAGAANVAAKVMVDPNTLQGTIAAENMPPLPPGKVYVLWTVLDANAPFTTDSKQAILTEVFEVDERGKFSREIVVPQAFRAQNMVQKVAVTIEDARAPQNHIGKPIMVAKL